MVCYYEFRIGLVRWQRKSSLNIKAKYCEKIDDDKDHTNHGIWWKNEAGCEMEITCYL